MPDGEITKPWYSDKVGTILYYRVNRRPLSVPTLFANQPDDVLDHFVEVLPFGEAVITGHRFQREWRLGDRAVRESERLLCGSIGWQAAEQHSRPQYDEEAKSWRESTDEGGRGAFSCFVFDAETRVLGVLRHGSIDERAVPQVFRIALNRGEAERESGASTDWDVEPVGDTEQFTAWIRSVDSVRLVQFVAKLPNPAPLEAFGPVWDRMELHRAKAMKEIMEAADPTLGLVDLEDDAVVRAYLAMTESAFGYVTAKGSRDGHDRTFDQRTQMAKSQTQPLPSTWADLLSVVIDFVKRRRRAGDS